MLVWVP